MILAAVLLLPVLPAAGGQTAGLEASIDPAHMSTLGLEERSLQLTVPINATDPSQLELIELRAPPGLVLNATHDGAPEGYLQIPGASTNLGQTLLFVRSPTAQATTDLALDVEIDQARDVQEGVHGWRLTAGPLGQPAQATTLWLDTLIDNHAPVVTQAELPATDPTAWTNQDQVTVAWTADEACPPPSIWPAGCPVQAALQVPGHDGPIPLATTTPGSPGQATVELPPGIEGDLDLTVRAQDGAQLATTSDPIALKIDRSQPETTVETDLSGWSDGPVTVDLICQDAVSACRDLEAGVDGGQLTPVGTEAGTVEIAGHGGHALTVASADIAGNQEAAKTHTVRIDERAPTTTASLATGSFDAWTTSPPTVTLTCQDPGIGCSTTTYQIDDGPLETYQAPVTIDEEGPHTLAFHSEDGVGHTEDPVTRTVKVDTVPPTLAQAPFTTGWLAQAPTDLDVGLVDPDPGSGLDSQAVAVGTTSSCQDATGWTDLPIGQGADLTDRLTPGAANHVCLKGTDVAGNAAGPIAAAQVLFDPTQPQVDLVPQIDANQAGWYDPPVPVTLAPAGASPSGIEMIEHRVDDGSGPSAWTQATPVSTTEVAVEGQEVVLEARGTTQAGVTGPSTERPLSIDLTPPSLTAEATEPGWTNTPPEVSFAAEDALSGLTAIHAELVGVDGGLQGPIPVTAGTFTPTLPGDGEHEVVLHAQDTAGHVTTSQPVTLRWDTTPPTTEATLDGQVGEQGWYAEPVAVAFTCTDPQAGCDETLAGTDTGQIGPVDQGFTIDTPGRHTITFHSTDAAGNLEARQERAFGIDVDAPALELVVPEDPRAQRALDLQVNLTDLSGVQSVTWTIGDQAPVSHSLGAVTDGHDTLTYRFDHGGLHTLAVTATDLAGHTAETELQIDVAPVRTTVAFQVPSGDEVTQDAGDAGDPPASETQVTAEESQDDRGRTLHRARVTAEDGKTPTVTTSDGRLGLQLETQIRERLTVEMTPDTVPERAPHQVYRVHRYLDLAATGTDGQPATVQAAQVTFTLSGQELRDLDAGPRQVVLLHFDGDIWRRLATTYQGQDGELHRFSATSTSLSPFAISVDERGDDEPPAAPTVEAVVADARTRPDGSMVYTAELTTQGPSTRTVTTTEGELSLRLDLPDAGTYRFEATLTQTPPSDRPASPSAYARYLTVSVTTAEGKPVDPGATDLQVTVDQATVHREDGRLDQLVVATPDENTWTPIEHERTIDAATATATLRTDRSLRLYGILLDTQPPEVGLASLPPAQLTEPVVLDIVASDDLAVDRVEVLLDGDPLGLDDDRPFEIPLDPATLPAGEHTIDLVATDAGGNQATSTWALTVPTGEDLGQTTTDDEPDADGSAPSPVVDDPGLPWPALLVVVVVVVLVAAAGTALVLLGPRGD